MNFRSIAQLNDQLLRWSRTLPADIDVIAGVPRSGLLAANLLALHLNVPLTDVDGLLSGRCYISGARRRRLAAGNGSPLDEACLSEPRTVLVLDDSLLSGRAMWQVRERIGAASLPHRVLYGAVYVAPSRVHTVDFCCEVLNEPRVFEWNVLHGGILKNFCVALDGVLCPAPAAEVAADAERLACFAADVAPLVVPSTEIGWIMADRPAALRAATESWLKAHGYRYRNLVMLDVAPGSTQSSPRLLPASKAEQYAATDAVLYLEPSLRQSIEIAQLSGRDVLCMETMQLVRSGTAPLPRSDTPVELHPPVRPSLASLLVRQARAAARRVLPKPVQDAIRRRRAGTSTAR
jgi:orotate phosphoribosyltransferase